MQSSAILLCISGGFIFPLSNSLSRTHRCFNLVSASIHNLSSFNLVLFIVQSRFSTSLLARPLFSVFRFFVHIGLEYMFTHSGLQAEFPPNTNILYVDLPFAELVGLSKNVNNIPLPGIVLITRKPMVYVDQFGRQCRGSQLEALEIQPPPLILLPTVIAAFSNRRRSQAITDMHSAAFMGVSAAVHFLSLLFSVTNSLITITLLHHHRNPLFSTKKGQNQFQVLSISPSHHLINPLNFGK
ncbi:hypothetical protein P8452_13667 [Trifolium repens]|nr:hypothetical protein P8452_13667 [Trifolium repens]